MTVSTFADPSGVSNPTSGSSAPATWFSQLNTNFLAIRNRPCARIENSSTQSFSASSVTAVTLGTVSYDNSSLMSGTANKLTIPTSYGGIWVVAAQIRITSTPSASHFVTLELWKNGAISNYAEFVQRSAASGSTSSMSPTWLVQLSVADVLELKVTTSGSISAISTVVSAPTSLSAFWLSP